MKPNIKHCLAGFITLVSLFSGCTQKDDIEPDCTSACTVITGRFTTDDRNTGLANVPLELKWVNFTGISHADIHRKATTTTDANGNYTLRFYINDNELGDGVYKVSYEIDAAPYIVDRDNQGPSLLGDAVKRDTLIVCDWLLPRKAFIHSEVTNPTQVNNNFSAEYGFEHGPPATAGYFNYGIPCSFFTPGQPVRASFDTEVAANQPVELKVIKSQGGQQLIQRDTIQLAAGAHYTHQVTY